ncbi:hypothetical protein KJ855_03170 [Patescibacteria group bacterium]|nr:hypothetical protein [Patescibacteria group bacterium]
MGSGYFTIRVPKPKDPNDVDSSDEENSSDEEFILKVVKEGETETDGDTVVGVPYDKVVELNLYKNKNHKDTNPEVPSNRDYYYFQSPFTEI